MAPWHATFAGMRQTFRAHQPPRSTNDPPPHIVSSPVVLRNESIRWDLLGALRQGPTADARVQLIKNRVQAAVSGLTSGHL